MSLESSLPRLGSGSYKKLNGRRSKFRQFFKETSFIHDPLPNALVPTVPTFPLPPRPGWAHGKVHEACAWTGDDPTHRWRSFRRWSQLNIAHNLRSLGFMQLCLQTASLFLNQEMSKNCTICSPFTPIYLDWHNNHSRRQGEFDRDELGPSIWWWHRLKWWLGQKYFARTLSAIFSKHTFSTQMFL